MNNFELFHHNPLEWQLVNDGVSSNNTTDESTLAYELKTFVCEGQYLHALDRILTGFLQHANDSEVPAAWISGFYGSGKSHLVKILRYLWNNHQLSSGAAARSLTTLPNEITDQLKELTTMGNRQGGLQAIGGTLKSGSGNVRLRLLSLVFQAVGLPESFPQAKFCLALKHDGKWDAFQDFVEAKGKKLTREFRKFYTSKTLQEAYLEAYPHLSSLEAVAQTIRQDFADIADLSIEEMLETIKDAISTNGELPYTLIVLDELQQFIGDDAAVALDVQEVVEACSKQMNGKVMIVATGQSALNETPNLQRLLGRFTIKIGLSDSDVESVIRKIALRKKDNKINDIGSFLNTHEGEVTRQLASTKICTQPDDRDYYVSDYPLLPVRRRFWEKVLRSVDSTGSTGQLRTQLRVVHEANKSYAEKPLGHVVAADFIYEQLSTQLVTLGELQKRFQEIIEEQKSKPNGGLRSRVCALTYLINKLPSEGGADLGVRANEEQLADLLIEDLDKGGSILRSELPAVLDDLVSDGVLMQIDDQYRLQTTEGAAWEQEYQSRVSQLKNENVRIANELNNRIQYYTNRQIGNLSIPHGAANTRRPVRAHFGVDAPDSKTDGIPLWVRSGWSETHSQVLDHIRSLSEEDTTLFLFIPQLHNDALRSAIAEELASDGTLTFKGSPSTPEGIDARNSMESRKKVATNKVQSLLSQILSEANLYLAGGEERPIISLQEAIQDAGAVVLTKVYHKFSDADSGKWSSVLKKAKEGNGNALAAVDYQGDPDKHPVSSAILLSIGAGKTGNEIRNLFKGAPYGWPQDAIDATLATLLLTGHLSASFQGKPVTEQDDQRRLGSASYKVEGSVLTAKEKMVLRKFMTEFGTKVGPADVEEGSKDFIRTMIQLASQAGGDAPLPAAPSHPALRELAGQQGNALMKGILDRKDTFTADFKKWQELATLASTRTPLWNDIKTLSPLVESIETSPQWKQQIDDITAARSLLNEQDPVTQLREEMTDAARLELNKLYSHYNKIKGEVTSRLDDNPSWAALTLEEKQSKLQQAGVQEFPAPSVADSAEVISSLRSTPLTSWVTRIDALPAQAENALSQLVKELEPKATKIHLPGATIKSEEDLEKWLSDARSRVSEALTNGPVIL